MWGIENGLHALITSALTMSIIGYPFILPDMVGGNAYNQSREMFYYCYYCDCYVAYNEHAVPQPELYIRWVQATVFMPSIQFSIPPWHVAYKDVLFEGQSMTELTLNMYKLRESYANYILETAQKTTQTGEPMIRYVKSSTPYNSPSQSVMVYRRKPNRTAMQHTVSIRR